MAILGHWSVRIRTRQPLHDCPPFDCTGRTAIQDDHRKPKPDTEYNPNSDPTINLNSDPTTSPASDPTTNPKPDGTINPSTKPTGRAVAYNPNPTSNPGSNPTVSTFRERSTYLTITLTLTLTDLILTTPEYNPNPLQP